MLAADGTIANETHSNRRCSGPARGDEDKTADQLLEGRAPVVMEAEVNESPLTELTLIPDDLLRVAPARAQEDRRLERRSLGRIEPVPDLPLRIKALRHRVI